MRWMTLLLTALVLFLVAPVASAKGSSALTPKQAIKKIESGEITPFKKKVRAIVGSSLKVSVQYEAAGTPATDPYYVKDAGAYLVRGVADKQLTLNALRLVVEALTAVASDAAGKRALRAGLKEIRILAVVGDAQLTFKDGVLTYGSHLYGDGFGTSIGADGIQKLLEKSLSAGSGASGAAPASGSGPSTAGLALNHSRAIEKLEAEQTAPFRAKVLAIVPNAKVTVEYAPPADQDSRPYAIKDVPAYVVRTAGNTNLTLNSFNMIVEALNEVASDELGKRALREQLKSVVVYAVIGDGIHSFKDGVLTVGSHIYGDGAGTSIPASTTQKDLEWGLTSRTSLVAGTFPLAHVRAIERIEAEQVKPFREQVKSMVGPTVKVSANYAPPKSGNTFPEKEPGKYMVLAADGTRVKYRATTQLTDALNDVDGSLKGALKTKLREIVIVPTQQSAQLSFQNGVLTLGYGENDSYGASEIRKALEAGLR
ncbi:MAG: hypothetical protein U0235_23840 [Polyangiaceae bacterium]